MQTIFVALKKLNKIDLTKPMSERTCPDNAIGAILYYFKENQFTYNNEIIQTEFRKITKEYADFFKRLEGDDPDSRFVFRENYGYPSSRLLYDVMDRLCSCRLLILDDYIMCPNHYVMTPEVRKSIENVFLPQFTENEKKEIAEIAEKFEKYLAIADAKSDWRKNRANAQAVAAWECGFP